MVDPSKKPKRDLITSMGLSRKQFDESRNYRYGFYAIGALVIVIVILFGVLTIRNLSGPSRWTSECQERAENSYKPDSPYTVKQTAKACVDRADEIEGLGESDSEVREILDEFGPLDQK